MKLEQTKSKSCFLIIQYPLKLNFVLKVVWLHETFTTCTAILLVLYVDTCIAGKFGELSMIRQTKNYHPPFAESKCLLTHKGTFAKIFLFTKTFPFTEMLYSDNVSGF